MVRRPSRRCLTHGFIVDEEAQEDARRAPSTKKPQTSDAYVSEYGADVIRLWIALAGFPATTSRSRRRSSPRQRETYRLVRNTLRSFQLANLFDFDAARHCQQRRRRWMESTAGRCSRRATSSAPAPRAYDACMNSTASTSSTASSCSVTLSATLPRHPQGQALHVGNRQPPSAVITDGDPRDTSTHSCGYSPRSIPLHDRRGLPSFAGSGTEFGPGSVPPGGLALHPGLVAQCGGRGGPGGDPEAAFQGERGPGTPALRRQDRKVARRCRHAFRSPRRSPVGRPRPQPRGAPRAFHRLGPEGAGDTGGPRRALTLSKPGPAPRLGHTRCPRCWRS